MKFSARILVLLALFAATFAFAQLTNTPFQHVIIVIQENRTPDNLFGSDLYNNPRRLPGAHLVSHGSCVNPDGSHTQIPLTAYQLDACFDPDHGHGIPTHANAWLDMFDNGNMDGACKIFVHVRDTVNCHPPQCTSDGNYQSCPEYTYVDNTPTFPTGHGIVDPYFNIAQNYGYANWMFQTNQGPSFPAHQFLFSGTSAPITYNDVGGFYQWFAAENLLVPDREPYGCLALQGKFIYQAAPDGSESKGYSPFAPYPDPGYPCYEHATLTDLLDNNKPQAIPWRYYGAGDPGGLWNAPNAISHICSPQTVNGKLQCTGSHWMNGDVTTSDPGQVLIDLGDNTSSHCNLKPISWVIPDGHWSDHPGKKDAINDVIDAGPSWVAAIINAVGGYDNDGHPLPTQCNYWANTVVLVTWDDWGGWYDDASPATSAGGPGIGYSNGTGGQYVHGFRVPLLAVSPYSKPAYISGPISNPQCPNYYCHDFGSILNFVEYVLGVGTIGDPNYPYADFLAPDVFPTCQRDKCPKPYSLADFFDFTTFHNFTKVTGRKYPTSYFIPPVTYFQNYPMDTDDDANDTSD